MQQAQLRGAAAVPAAQKLARSCCGHHAFCLHGPQAPAQVPSQLQPHNMYSNLRKPLGYLTPCLIHSVPDSNFSHPASIFSDYLRPLGSPWRPPPGCPNSNGQPLASAALLGTFVNWATAAGAAAAGALGAGDLQRRGVVLLGHSYGGTGLSVRARTHMRVRTCAHTAAANARHSHPPAYAQASSRALRSYINRTSSPHSTLSNAGLAAQGLLAGDCDAAGSDRPGPLSICQGYEAAAGPGPGCPGGGGGGGGRKRGLLRGAVLWEVSRQQW